MGQNMISVKMKITNETNFLFYILIHLKCAISIIIYRIIFFSKIYLINACWKGGCNLPSSNAYVPTNKKVCYIGIIKRKLKIESNNIIII